MIILTPKEFRQYIKTTLKDINELDNIHIKLKKIIVKCIYTKQNTKYKKVEYNAIKYIFVENNIKYLNLLKRYNIKLNDKFIQNIVENYNNSKIFIWCLKNKFYIISPTSGILNKLHRYIINYEGWIKSKIIELYIKYIDIEDIYENNILEMFISELYKIENPNDDLYKVTKINFSTDKLLIFVNSLIKYNKMNWNKIKPIIKLMILDKYHDKNKYELKNLDYFTPIIDFINYKNTLYIPNENILWYNDTISKCNSITANLEKYKNQIVFENY
jgi:hypothetical protein